jgi:hypothetical protein
MRLRNSPEYSSPVAKPEVPQLLNKFSTFYGTQKFIAMFTTACHLFVF